MTIFNQILNVIADLIEFISSLNFLIIFALLIIFNHILFYLIRDRKYIRAVKKNRDPETISINDLKELPLINILVPAWKEGKEFKECLLSITKLSYPSIKIIVNAGGSQETITIANSFKKYNTFLILHQKGGKSRAALGKIRALNECLDYVNEGLVYFIDADCYLTDELLLRMIFPIINENEKVIRGSGLRPLKSQENNDLVNYLQFNRMRFFRYKFTRYHKTSISGANTCLSYEVIKSIRKFKEDSLFGEDVSRGLDIISKGFKIYWLTDYRSRMYTYFPGTIKEHILDRIRYIENLLIFSYKTKKIKNILKVLFFFLVSVYFLIFPVFLILNLGLFFIGVFILCSIYLKRVRAYLVFKNLVDKKYYTKFRKRVFLKMIYYIYIETISKILIPFHFIKYLLSLKK